MHKDKFEQVLDALKIVLQWLVVTVVLYIWWTTVLLILSLILVSVWHILLVDLLKLSGALTLICSVLYGVIMHRRSKKL